MFLLPNQKNVYLQMQVVFLFHSISLSRSAAAACAVLVRDPLGRGDAFSCTRDLADIDCGKR